jgi:hypothetical protein
MGHNWYATEIESIWADHENMEGFLECGDSVLLVSCLEDVIDFGIDLDSVEIID